MDRFTLTAQMIEAASDYIPNAEKEAFVARNAEFCIDTAEVRFGIGNAAPPLHMENASSKARFLMTALVRDYLHLDAEHTENNDDLMTQEGFDRYASAHIINQIERLKADAKIRDKCFDILQDYRELEKRMNVAVYGMVRIMNDTVGRMIATTDNTMTPDRAEELLRELKSAEAELQKLREGKNDAV